MNTTFSFFTFFFYQKKKTNIRADFLAKAAKLHGYLFFHISQSVRVDLSTESDFIKWVVEKKGNDHSPSTSLFMQ